MEGDHENQEWKGASFKDEEDYSKEADEVLAKVNATTAPVLLRSCRVTGSNSEKLQAVLEPLFVLEKTARLGGDVNSCRRLAVEILHIFRCQKEYNTMLTVMLELMKRRAQAKAVQFAMVEECAIILADGSVGKDDLEEVLQRLAFATENKIHVELQHARFSVQLASLHEARQEKQKALDMLRGLQVEAITTMPRSEKLHVLNQEIRLALELNAVEFIPTISRKISCRALAAAESREEKMAYFGLMREFYLRQELYFHVSRCWLETFLSLDAASSAEERIKALSSTVLFYLIADYSGEKQIEDHCEYTAFSPETRFTDRSAALTGLCERFRSDLEDIPLLHALLKRFNSIVIVRDKVMQDVETVCHSYSELQAYPDRQKLLRDRCSEHDLLVISTFYTRVPMARLAELVGLTEEHTEAFLMNMVSQHTLYAKMDRVDGLVEFEAKKNTAEVVESWNEAVERCVSLLDEASHLITKERMLANAPKEIGYA